MTDRDPGRFTQGNGVIAAAIVIAAVIVSWGSSGSQPRYQIAGSGSMIVRLDTDSGELIGCDQQGCRRIEAPDRAKTWGPLRVVFGNVEKNVQNNVEQKQAQQKQLPPKS